MDINSISEVAMAKFKRDLENRAQKYAGRGQIGKAIAEYRNLVSIYSTDVRLRHKLGELLAQNGDCQGLAHCAIELSRASQTEEFLLAAEQALELDAANLALLNGLARAHLERREIGLALQRLDESLRQEPNCVESLWLLARAFDMLGKPQKVAMVGRQLREICQDRGDPTSVRKIAQEVSLLAGGADPGLVPPKPITIGAPRQTPEEDLIAAQFEMAKKKPVTINDQPTRIVHIPLGMFDSDDEPPEICSDDVIMLPDDDDLEEVSGVYSA